MAGIKRKIKYVAFLFLLPAVFFSFMNVSYSYYKERPKRHFLSWESLNRPEEYKRLSKYLKPQRRFKLSRGRVVKLKKSSMFDFRPYQFSSPLLVGDRIFVGVDAGYFYGIDASLREKNWTYETKGAVQSMAAYDNGVVYFGDCKRYFYALDAKTGKEIWTTPLDTSMLSRPLIINDIVFVLTMSDRLYAIDKNSGVEIWHTDSHEKGFGFSVRKQAGPILYDGLIYIGTSSGLVIAFQKQNGNIAWVRRIGNIRKEVYDVDSEPIFINGKMFITDASGSLVCMDPKTGRVFWQAEAGGSNNPLYHEGRLYLTGGNTVYCFDPETGVPIWEQELDAAGLSAPAGGLHFIAVVSTDEKMYILDSESGGIALERYVRKGSFGDPVIAGETVWVLSNSARLFPFRIKEIKSRKVVAIDSSKSATEAVTIQEVVQGPVSEEVIVDEPAETISPEAPVD